MFNYFYKLRNRNNKKGKKGFTLIELIIVIAILAILAAILVPSMLGYQKEAKISVANANARTLYSAASAAVASPSVKDASSISTFIDAQSLGNTGFQGKLKALLGAGFVGQVTVTVDANAVTEVSWRENANAPADEIGVYNPTTTTP